MDADGQTVRCAEDEVSFELTGPGDLLALGSANPLTEELYVGSRHKAFQGRLMAVVRANGEAGEMRLSAKAEGMKRAEKIQRGRYKSIAAPGSHKVAAGCSYQFNHSLRKYLVKPRLAPRQMGVGSPAQQETVRREGRKYSGWHNRHKAQAEGQQASQGADQVAGGELDAAAVSSNPRRQAGLASSSRPVARKAKEGQQEPQAQPGSRPPGRRWPNRFECRLEKSR